MDSEKWCLIIYSWRENLVISILMFFNVKNWPKFANFEPFFPPNSILLIFWIEWMFPKCSQILVQDFRHQNFGIWIILGWVREAFKKKKKKVWHLSPEGGGQRVFVTNKKTKKNSQNDFWAILSIFGFLVLTLFFGGGSNPGGWRLDLRFCQRCRHF